MRNGKVESPQYLKMFEQKLFRKSAELNGKPLGPGGLEEEARPKAQCVTAEKV